MTFSAAALEAFAAGVLQEVGVPADDARLLGETLVAADLRGHHSHGLFRLPTYVRRLLSGAMQTRTRLTVVTQGGAVAVLDAHDGIGQVAAHHATNLAVERARDHGVGVVGVRRSNHFGMAMDYTLQAVRAGCIGFMTTNASPAMAPWGGSRRLIGNNPWSVALPAGRRAPVALDIANTVVARGKIRVAAAEGEAIPAGWATDGQGRPTTDPAAAVEGLILPMAGHKGYGISLIMDLLAAALTGAAMGSDVPGSFDEERAGGRGHLAMALHVAHFMPLEEFAGRVAQRLDEVKRTPAAGDAGEVFYPGELEARREAQHRARGLSLPPSVAAGLKGLARDLDMAYPF